jgi:hypothetical protein
MATVVILLVMAAFVVWVGLLVATFMFHQTLKRRALPLPEHEDWSLMRASYPPDVHRARLWLFVCVVLFSVLLVTIVVLAAVFDVCPGCVATGPTA